MTYRHTANIIGPGHTDHSITTYSDHWKPRNDTLDQQQGGKRQIDPSHLSIQSINISGKREDHNEDSHDVQKDAESVQSRLKNSLLQRKLLVLVQIIEVTRAGVVL